MYCSTRRRKDIYDEEDFIDPDEIITIPSTNSSNSRYQRALYGYTGFVPRKNHEELEEEYDSIPSKQRIMIRGYSGHLNKTLDVCGVPLIPSLEAQQQQQQQRSRHGIGGVGDGNGVGVSSYNNETGPGTPQQQQQQQQQSHHLQDKVEQSTLGSSFTNFRTYGKHMELEERYSNAINKLFQRGQTSQMLLRMIQCKLSENIKTFAELYCRSKKIFEYFDLDQSGTLDEYEFRQFLELQNCYFDDIQSLALFAYFDSSKTGGITWEQFEKHAIISNPQGGTGVIPKAITANNKSNDWKSVSRIVESQRKK
jgi:Ca2+-binding EF-hand superfamily protein